MAPASSPSFAFNPLLIPTESSASSCHSSSSAAPRLSKVRVLVVGAGGIGCEVCKDLLLSGFRRLCVVDLDTIDVSNLNRQFFFRNVHVGLSKAFVLAASCSALIPREERQSLAHKRARAVRQLKEAGDVDSECDEEDEESTDGKHGPDAKGEAPSPALSETATEGEGVEAQDVCIDGRTVWGVVGQKMNILSSGFTVQLLQTYEVVISALDNQKARRHLNGLCIAAGVPLIEAGSTGYSGQVMPILKNETLCYDCEAKPRDQQRFPVCTLRQRPERPEHCIAWAKMIYELVFGVEDNENLLSDLKEQLRTFLIVSPVEPESAFDGDSTAGATELGAAAESKRERAEAMRLMSRKMMKELFHDQIVELLRLSQENKDAPKKNDILPTPLCVQGLTGATSVEDRQRAGWENAPATNGASRDNASVKKTVKQGGEGKGLESQRTWSVQECQEVFERSFLGLLERQKTTERDAKAGTGKREAGIPFDKDDDLAMDFVAAAANLRMHNFHIPLKSRWSIQAIAGSIIPAIAATNAVVASLQVVQLLHLLQFLHSEGRLRHERSAAVKAESGKTEPAKTLRTDSKCRYVWVKPFVTGVRPEAAGRLILPEVMDPPKASCFLCQQQTVTIELISLKAWNIETFVERIVKGELGLAHPYVDSESRNLYDVDEVDEQRQNGEEDDASPLKQPLANFGIVSGSILTATDFSRGDFQCNLLLLERPELGEKDKDDPHTFRVVRESGASWTAEKETEALPADGAKTHPETQEEPAREADQGGIDVAGHGGGNGRAKRPRNETREAASSGRQHLGNATDAEIVVLDDDGQEQEGHTLASQEAKKRKEGSPSFDEAEIVIDDDDN
ncbi:AFR138Wp, related [Neospora caninum Liverpool]|uniref:AFR138Wp, related n=1 Tax=Neospora caninum (strain Liverpool) TaxID=572307 RepID=F0VN18_NEOCL|nr:AFR138Wp, related [Neospora caninum Liverpool]CBZ55114.1 AFR138Wp, related [Neospora caninum Liverpool]CEL69840.1 TPA: AFR138Wp, related [Neospora caninum Liverpool]|eukprot:XP_003885142.1 AFR138Wp, related [Neospora caninum Liverpool]